MRTPAILLLGLSLLLSGCLHEQSDDETGTGTTGTFSLSLDGHGTLEFDGLGRDPFMAAYTYEEDSPSLPRIILEVGTTSDDPGDNMNLEILLPSPLQVGQYDLSNGVMVSLEQHYYETLATDYDSDINANNVNPDNHPISVSVSIDRLDHVGGRVIGSFNATLCNAVVQPTCLSEHALNVSGEFNVRRVQPS